MSPVELVIDRFGSQTEVSRVLGITQSSVSYWSSTGRIPRKHHVPLLAAAAQRGIDLAPSDLVSQAVRASTESDPPNAVCEGELSIGTVTVPCYVLENGKRVISRSGALRSIAATEETRTGGDLEKYLVPLGFEFKNRAVNEMIEFTLPGVSKRTAGVTADFFLEICKAYVVARDTGQLTTERQISIAIRANVFILACAGVGLTALIDEATGYQYIREENALQTKLALFLESEMRAWDKTFPDELWVEFGRLTSWQGSIKARPKYWGHYVNSLIYDALDHDVAEWLKANAPAPKHGQNYHQWLSSQFGLKKLTEHIWMIIGMARACQTMRELQYRVAEQFGKDVLELQLFADVPVASR